MEIIDDLTVLGLAVPEEIGDGRRTVCLGGYSPSRGFIRVYPCRPDMQLHRWDILRVQVERNPKDSRHESWKLIGSNPEWEVLNKYVQHVGQLKDKQQRRQLLETLCSPCVSEVNNRRDSLGIVKAAKIHRAYFGQNPQYGKEYQAQMFKRPGEWAQPKRDYAVEPRLTYTCSECATQAEQHDQKVLEWGAFEWMRKNPSKLDQYWENARLYAEDYDIYLHVGNQANQRTSFMVINVIPMKRDEKQELSGARAAKQLSLF